MKRKTLLTALTILLAVSFSGSVYAIPQLIDYQGKLLENGAPPQVPVNITFSIYNADSGGTPLWSEAQSVTVDIDTGLFNVLLSIDDPAGTIFDGNNRWLGIQVESDEEMTPRKKIVSVAHAYQAKNAEKLGGQVPSYYLNTSSAIDADTLGGQAPSYYLNTSSTIDADTLGGQAPSYYLNTSSTIDADTLGGQAPSYYLNTSSTIDADKLGGQAPSYYLNASSTAASADKLDNYDSTYFINTSGGQTINNNLTVDRDLFVNDDLIVDDELTISTSSDMSGSLELYGDLEIHENSATYALEVRQDGPYYGVLIRNDSVAGNYPALKVKNYGDGPAADFDGAIYQRGSVLHADYVFESDYNLESIEDHSKAMWQEKHLPAVPKAKIDENGQEILEIGSHRKGILEELEKAHIYIEKLNSKIKELEQKMEKLELVKAELGESSEK